MICSNNRLTDRWDSVIFKVRCLALQTGIAFLSDVHDIAMLEGTVLSLFVVDVDHWTGSIRSQLI
jgi:hypothetical protein